MQKSNCYDNYPFWIIAITNTVQLAMYTIGAIIIYNVHLALLFAYIGYIIFMEIMLLKNSCVNCFYYAKRCAFGKGKLCALLFKQGYPEKFNAKKITWKDLLPDLTVPLFPLLTGIVLLLVHFTWLLLFLLIMLILLASIGNALVRGSLACKHCAQKEAGCPADQLFSKK